MAVMVPHQEQSSFFRRNLEGLRRLPTHWKLLLGSQLVFTVFALNYRRKLVERRRRELETEQ